MVWKGSQRVHHPDHLSPVCHYIWVQTRGFPPARQALTAQHIHAPLVTIPRISQYALQLGDRKPLYTPHPRINVPLRGGFPLKIRSAGKSGRTEAAAHLVSVSKSALLFLGAMEQTEGGHLSRKTIEGFPGGFTFLGK